MPYYSDDISWRSAFRMTLMWFPNMCVFQKGGISSDCRFIMKNRLLSVSLINRCIVSVRRGWKCIFWWSMKILHLVRAMEALADRAVWNYQNRATPVHRGRGSGQARKTAEINKAANIFTCCCVERGARALNYFRKRELIRWDNAKFDYSYSDQYGDDLYQYLPQKGPKMIFKESGLVSIDEARRVW